MLSFVIGVGLEALAQSTDKTTDLSKLDSASELFDANGKVLTRVTVKNGKIDFSRTAGQSRTEFVKTLYTIGLRKIHSSVLSPLAINSQGQIGLALPGGGGLFQSLKEKDDGFDLANGEGSQILAANGNVLATVTTEKGSPALVFATGQSLKTLYDAGLRFFYYKFEPIKGEMKLHGIKLTQDDKGEVKLEP